MINVQLDMLIFIAMTIFLTAIMVKTVIDSRRNVEARTQYIERIAKALESIAEDVKACKEE